MIKKTRKKSSENFLKKFNQNKEKGTAVVGERLARREHGYHSVNINSDESADGNQTKRRKNARTGKPRKEKRGEANDSDERNDDEQRVHFERTAEISLKEKNKRAGKPATGAGHAENEVYGTSVTEKMGRDYAVNAEKEYKEQKTGGLFRKERGKKTRAACFTPHLRACLSRLA